MRPTRPTTLSRTARLLAACAAVVTIAAPAAAQVPDPTEETTWAFEPGRDEFSPDALLDLRSMNEAVAGETGFVRVDEGGDFVKGDGSPLRFWAVNTWVWRRPGDLAEHARFLAKRGVNNVRYHGNVVNPDGPIGSIDEVDRDRLWRLVAAMKAEGIYTTFSPYYAHATHKTRESWGLPRDPEAKNTGSLLFFDAELQEAYKGWMRQVLTPVNPHTGVALKDEPALALVQIQNEDSLLFWTFNALDGGDLDLLRAKYGEWLTGEYGSLDAARAAWDGAKPDGNRAPDDFDAGLVSFVNLFELFQPERNVGGLAVRMADQARFLTETMRAWNEEVERYLRDDLGVQQVVNAGNWRTADPLRLNDLERYSYDANAVVGLNRYTNGHHKGEHEGWAITTGDVYGDLSVTREPGQLPVAVKQVRGRAFVFPEGHWVPPTGYQSEGPFLVAAYSALNGVDGFYWFSTESTQWRQPASANGFLPSVGKWQVATPAVLGQFPAAAIMLRNGYVDRAEPAVVEHRALADLWARRAPVVSEQGTFDPNRDAADLAAVASPVKAAVDRLAFLVGPVEAVYDSDPAKTTVADLSKFVDESAETVTSSTGQLRWDYGDGLVTVDAPKAQGATGFLAEAGRVELADVAIDSTNDYATVTVVSMDDRPLAASGKVLIQSGTAARPTGWRTKPAPPPADGKVSGTTSGELREVVEFGAAPWRVFDNATTVTVRNPTLTEAVKLDPNGNAAGAVPVTRDGDALTVELPPDALYVVLR